jgi:cyclophilin family peptidyl-prolyl cis-trans isomerase
VRAKPGCAPTYPDIYYSKLKHATPGLLSMANAGKDTNGNHLTSRHFVIGAKVLIQALSLYVV